MKKFMGLLASLIFLTGIFSGCADTPVKDINNNTNLETTNADNNEWPRTIVDAAGNQVTLEKKPERIAILHSLYLEYFFALETPPCASAGSSVGDAMKAIENWETLKPYKGVANILDLGSSRQLNLEAILQSAPDVIITFKSHGGIDEIYDQLVKIALVVLLDFEKPWQQQTLDCAQIIGKEDFAKELIEKTENEISFAKEIIETKSHKTFAIFRTDGGKSFVTRGDNVYYDTFGLTMPQEYPDQYKTVSLETLAQMNPDYIVLQDFIDTSKTFVKNQETSSVWQKINAVNNENIYYFDDSLNTFGPLSMQLTAKKLKEIYSN